MSHIEFLQDGTKVRKRDVVDDLKEFIARYEFYDDEVHRLWKDYEELEAENERLKQEKNQLLLALSQCVWQDMSYKSKANTRKWMAKQ